MLFVLKFYQFDIIKPNGAGISGGLIGVLCQQDNPQIQRGFRGRERAFKVLPVHILKRDGSDQRPGMVLLFPVRQNLDRLRLDAGTPGILKPFCFHPAAELITVFSGLYFNLLERVSSLRPVTPKFQGAVSQGMMYLIVHFSRERFAEPFGSVPVLEPIFKITILQKILCQCNPTERKHAQRGNKEPYPGQDNSVGSEKSPRSEIVDFFLHVLEMSEWDRVCWHESFPWFPCRIPFFESQEHFLGAVILNPAQLHFKKLPNHIECVITMTDNG